MRCRSWAKTIERAYTQGEALGISVWCQADRPAKCRSVQDDEAGPYQTRAYDGSSWQSQGQPQKQDAEYVRAGTAKLLTLLHPQTGQVRVKGVERTTNAQDLRRGDQKVRR